MRYSNAIYHEVFPKVTPAPIRPQVESIVPNPPADQETPQVIPDVVETEQEEEGAYKDDGSEINNGDIE